MRRFPRAALGLAALVLIAAAFPADASAQIMTTFSWMPPKKVEEAMERDRVPGIFVFEIPGEPASTSIRFNFTQPQVAGILQKHKFACCKIALHDMKSSRPWGTYQKLADEFGVSLTTTLVIVTYDRQVMSVLSQVLKRDEFLVFLQKTAATHRERVKLADGATEDLNMAEKWLDEKKYADCSRRLKMVLEKEQRLPKKIIDRGKDLDGKLETIGNERLAEGKRLLDAGKIDEAKIVLDEVADAFARFECGKEAKELLKKANKA